MPRDAFGNYTLPAGNPVVTGTAIASSWANTTLNDIATALTNSLSIDGSVTTVKLADGAVTTIKLADSSVTTAKIVDANVTLTKLASEVKATIKNPNLLINSDMFIWQSAASLASGTGRRYTADMVYGLSSGSTYTAARTTMPVGTGPLNGIFKFYHNFTVTSVANVANYARFDCIAEYVNSIAGQVTISFYAKTNTTAKDMAVSIAQVFGTGGSPSGTVETAVGKVTIGTTWARYSFTTTIPSVSGKTLGSGGNDYISFCFWVDAGSNYNALTNSLGQRSGVWDFVGVKVETGPVMTDYDLPNIQDTLAKCQRYYETGSYIWRGQAVTGIESNVYLQFNVNKRSASPTMADINTSAVGFGTVSSIGALSGTGFEVYRAATATGAGLFGGNWVADCRL